MAMVCIRRPTPGCWDLGQPQAEWDVVPSTWMCGRLQSWRASAPALRGPHSDGAQSIVATASLGRKGSSCPAGHRQGGLGLPGSRLGMGSSGPDGWRSEGRQDGEGILQVLLFFSRSGVWQHSSPSGPGDTYPLLSAPQVPLVTQSPGLEVASLEASLIFPSALFPKPPQNPGCPRLSQRLHQGPCLCSHLSGHPPVCYEAEPPKSQSPSSGSPAHSCPVDPVSVSEESPCL